MPRYLAHVQISLEYETDREVEPGQLRQDSCQMIRQLLGVENPPQEFVLDRSGVEVSQCRVSTIAPDYILSMPPVGQVDQEALLHPHGRNVLQ